MKIHELLDLISLVANNKGLSEPFIVGGLPRDKIMGRLKEVQDIDLTNGDDTIKILANEVNNILTLNYPDVNMKTFPDGHSQISVQGMKVDFSSNFTSPQVKPLLKKADINASPMIVELMSRDFTCNALLMKLDLSTIKDPTGMGISDIKSKIIKTPIAPKYTLSNDPKRIIRVIYLATKLEFEVETAIIDFVSKNPSLVESLKDRYITDKINESLDHNADKTIKLITDMNLWNYIPISNRLAPYAVGRF